jgi:monofunctional biosynthetic peptidoglycan transglycosylase
MAKKRGNKFVQLLKNLLQWCIQLLVIGTQWAFLLIILYRVVPIPITPLHILRVYEQIREGKDIKLQKDWTGIDYLGENISLAVMAAEDGKFRSHYGFDFEQIQHAIERTMEKGKKLRGASTISQQTAKNIFFTPKRSWIRKVPEMGITVCLELLWTKKRIMEVYLNIIETGDGIYGMEAAAQFYFNKKCEDLSKKQCALIAACLPNPRTRRPDKPNQFISKKANKVVKGMNKLDPIDW